MEFKNIVQKIMENENLKSELATLKSFEEVHKFFSDNGYKGSAQELKESLLGKKGSISKIPEEKLENIAGGLSGRQVLATCAGIMMLTNSLPISGLSGNAETISTSTHVSATEKYNDETVHKLSHSQALKIFELDSLRSICSLYALAMGNDFNNNKEQEKVNYAKEFFCLEFLKCSADIKQILTGNDYKEYKDKLDKLLSSTDFAKFNETEFDAKRDKIARDFGFNNNLGYVDTVVDEQIDNSESEYNKLLYSKKISLLKRLTMLISINKTLDNYKKTLSDVMGNRDADNLTNEMKGRIKNNLKILQAIIDLA